MPSDEKKETSGVEPLTANADAATIRARFAELLDNMPTHYDEPGIWDEASVAVVLVREALAAPPAPQVTEAMCKEAAREFSVRFGLPMDENAWTDEDTQDWTHILTAALRGGAR